MAVNGYTCYCPNAGHTIGICIFWKDNTVEKYDCKYPACSKDCKLLKEYPIGSTRNCPNHSDN